MLSTILLVLWLGCVYADFTYLPSSVTLGVREKAVFQCRYPGASIIWNINDERVLVNSEAINVTSSGDQISDTLIITAEPEYNGSEVVCVAFLPDYSFHQAPSVYLIIELFPSPSSVSSTTGTPTESQTETPTTTFPSGGFLVTPLSQNVTNGTTVSFHCEHETGSVFWKINDNKLGLPSVTTSSIGGAHTLTITQPSLEYSGIKIQCIASLDPELVIAPPATLLLQGPLDAVRDIKVHVINSTISWKPPPSLDLTNIEPDIAYCVDVYNIACEGRELLISDCDVTETSYTSDVIAPDGYIYEYIVTSRSNVEGAVNGTPSKLVRDDLPTFIVSSTRLSDDNVGQNPDFRAYQTELTYTPNLPIPSSYSLSLQSLDGLEDMDHVETTATIEPSVLTLEVVSGLPFRRLWNCTILAFGCPESSIMNGAELSTYDFRDILSSSLHPGEVRVTGSFTDDSTATGVLVIVIGDSEVIYDKASRDGTDKIKETLITGLAGGEYSISVFVVEENGLPFERVATSPKLVAVETRESDVVTPPSSSIEYSLQSTSTGVCITCTFLDSSATDCVAVVHQQISQLSSSGLMNIESSQKLTRSGDTASGCIEGVNMEDYQVGVVGGRQVTLQEQGSKICDGCIAGSVLAVLLFLFFVVLAVVIILIRKMKMKRRIFHSQDSDIERRLCLQTNVYEECPNLKEHTCETTPLRVESDSPLSSEGREPPDLQAPSTLPPVTPHSAGLEPNEVVPEPTYAEPEFSKKKIISAPFADRVKYDEVKTFKNPQGQEYAMVVLPSPSGQTVPDDLHKTTSEYSEILHDQYRDGESVTTKKETKTEPEKCTQQCVDTPHALYTVENLLPILHSICSKWKKLGMAMSMDDDHLDQVFTNNEGDEACLQDLLERYMDNGDFKHNWEEIVAILKKMDENALASDIYDLHVHPYVDSLPRETHTELTQEDLDDLLVKEPPSEGQQSLLDVGSPHRQTQEEPNLSLELMHKESELTQNEVATDNLLAKEPQPEKPPTDSEHHQDTQHEQPQPTKRHKSDSANSDESSDSGFLSGASDENQSNSSNSSESEDEDSKGTKAVQPETQDLHKQAFVLGASGKILPESMKAPQLYHLSEKQVSTMQTKPSPTLPKQSRLSKNDVVASNLSCDLGSEDECQTVSNRKINGCYSFGVLLPCTSYFTENYCNNSEPEDNTIEIQASQPEDEDEFLLSYSLSTSTSLDLSRDDQHRLLLLSKHEHGVEELWQKRAKMYCNNKTQEFEENKRLRVDNSVKKRGDSVRTQRKSRL